MKRKRRWLLITILFISGAVFLLRWFWLPWALANGQTWLEFIDYNSPWMDLVSFIITVSPVLIWFFSREKPPTPPPPVEINVDKIINPGGKPANLIPEWRNRGIVSPDDYRRNPVLVLEGNMKTGKTREAGELLRRALKEDISSTIIDVSVIRQEFTTDAVRADARRQLEAHPRTVFYLEQIPVDATQPYLAYLQVFIEAVRQSGQAHFITTLRSDHLGHNPTLKKWLEDQQVFRVAMKGLDAGQKAELLDDLLGKFSVRLDADQYAEVLRCADDTPYHLVLILQKLRATPQGEIHLELIQKLSRQSAADIWIELRRDLQHAEPAVGALLQALKTFDMVGVRKRAQLVFAYAETLLPGVWLPILTRRRLERAAALLAKYELSFQQEFSVPDAVLEGLIIAGSPRDALFVFLTQPRSPLNPRTWEWLNHGVFRQAGEAVFDLSLSDYNNHRPEDAVQALRWLVNRDPNAINQVKVKQDEI